MRNKYLIIGFFSTALLLSITIMYGVPIVMNQPTEVLQRMAVPSTHYEMGMGIGEMSPNATKGHRIQSGPEMVYVLDGELILAVDGQPVKIIRAGESFQIPAGEPHETKAGASGAKFLAAWAVEQGKQDQFVQPIK